MRPDQKAALVKETKGTFTKELQLNCPICGKQLTAHLSLLSCMIDLMDDYEDLKTKYLKKNHDES